MARDGEERDHGRLMDRVYRRQRHFYDLTRRYYLLGRDRLIENLAPPPDATVLEVGCGTGRNLVCAARRHPQAEFFGVDISREMLATARRAAARAASAAEEVLTVEVAAKPATPSDASHRAAQRATAGGGGRRLGGKLVA